MSLVGKAIKREELESVLASRVVEALMNLGLASLDPSDGSRLFCLVVLYPVGSLSSFPCVMAKQPSGSSGRGARPTISSMPKPLPRNLPS